MEKTIVIDGKEVKFKSNGSTARRYKMQFGRDFISDIFKLAPLAKLDPENITQEAIEALDIEIFEDFAWALAKTADKDLPDPLMWLDGFEEFPIFDILPDIQDMLITNITQTKKK